MHRVKEGDHVVLAFLPACGYCRWCSTGHQNLCDRGANVATGRPLDGTYRIHARGRDVGAMATLGTFAPYAVAAASTLLLAAGIYGAWDVTLWAMRNRKE